MMGTKTKSKTLKNRKMKRITYLLVILAMILSIGCEEELGPVFLTSEGEGIIEFTNSFASEYLISEETEGNVADRFVWNEADFGVETNVTYEIQASLDQSFNSPEVLGSTNQNNFAIMISHLLDFAERLGLDDDPATTDMDGQPNNTGSVFFRVRAYTGTTGSDSPEMISDAQPLQMVWLEQVVVGGPCDVLWTVGDAIADAGWNFVISTSCDENVHRIKLALTTGVFRFFEIQGDWDSGLNFPYYEGEGYTIDANFENDGSNDANFRFIGTPGIYELVVDDNEKTIVLNPSSSLWAVGGAVPGGWGFNADTVEFVEISPDIWQASLALTNDIFRFFQTFEVWDTNNNYTFYEDAGFTIDSNFENDGSNDGNFNFVGTPGTYLVTINANDLTITLE